jgi:hypothetical protein
MSIDQSSLAKGQVRKLNAHVWFSIAAANGISSSMWKRNPIYRKVGP